ncbi:spore germination YkwD domain-containing protein [Aeromicrobium choanae]|uniref:Cysteine-rich secretory protein family protein n=1 Tax=Aeromicrobium choanae TaxID=1736691 RepID=A0A1T4YWA4_9ACTN|nr:hypothetical protein [Aeromicrobium choanae]SKB06062.1 hypothetical protein SAMN06295964_1158 [Aeromicrobium choanae]
MGHLRRIATMLVVATVATVLVGGAIVIADERETALGLTSTTVVTPAAAKPALRLSATPRTVDAGGTVTFGIRTSTKHPRTVRLQRWDTKRKAWRNAASRKVRGSATVRVRPAAGATRYRAVAPRVKHRTGGRVHRHASARSTTLTVTARAAKRAAPTRPATLSADEKTLLAAVQSARRTYARPEVQSAEDRGAEACLTESARRHSAWMASRGRAVDPGSAEHRGAGRQVPAAECRGRTVTAVTRALGGASSTTAVRDSVDAWLSSPYGETGRLLSLCHQAPGFEYGVAAPAVDGTRWLTVLIASDTATTRASGAC